MIWPKPGSLWKLTNEASLAAQVKTHVENHSNKANEIMTKRNRGNTLRIHTNDKNGVVNTQIKTETPHFVKLATLWVENTARSYLRGPSFERQGPYEGSNVSPCA